MSVTNYYKTKKWNQGHIIDDESSINALLKCSCNFISSNSQAFNFLVIISQNCDILHSPEAEPYIDFLFGRLSSNKDGNFWYGKNPRRLQVSLDSSNSKFGEFIIHDLFRVTKNDFMKVNPKKSKINLTPNDIKLITTWVSKRYTRSAFPNEFNQRLKKAEKKLTTLSKDPLMEFVSLIFIDTVDAELPSDQDYPAVFLIGVEHGLDQEINSKIEDLFYNSFNNPGIIAKIEVYDEYDITYKIMKTYKRFDWDYRSLPENPDISAPAPGINTI